MLKEGIKNILDNPGNSLTRTASKYYKKNKDNYKYLFLYYSNRINSFLRISKTRIGVLNIELTSVCNLKCRSCSLDRKRNDFMDMGFFKEVLDQILNERIKIREIALFNAGESLMHPRFGEFLEIIELKKEEFKRRGKEFPWVGMVTNATFLDKWKSKILATNALDEIRFSVDGGIKKEFEYNRRGAKWEDVLKKINDFLDENEKTRRMKTTVYSLISPKIKVSKEFRDLIKRVDVYVPRTPHNWDGKQELDAKIKKMARKGKQFKPKKRFCDIILNSAVILSDGRITPCCVDINAKGVLGDLKEKSFLDIYYGEKRQDMLKKMKMNKRQDIELCKNCGVMFG